MRTLLLVVFSVVVGAALGFGIAVMQIRMRPWNPKFDEGGATAASSISSPNKPTPKVAVDRTDYDFGTVDREVGGKHDFTFTNSGNAPLRISLTLASSPAATWKIEREMIPPGESGKVTITWKPTKDPGSERQTATVSTNDPARPEVELTITGRIQVLLRSSPEELALGRVSTGESATAQLRLWSYHDEPLKILGQQWSDPATGQYLEAAVQPLSAEDLAADPLARSGVRVEVTAKPGLPEGKLRQELILRTNLASTPMLMLPITGTISSEVVVVSRHWDPDRGILFLGEMSRSTGKQLQALLVARGPLRKEVTFKVADVTPSVLKVTIGEPREVNDGVVVETPLTIEIPPGSPSMNRLSTGGGAMGEITLETTHPRVPKLQMHVSFAIEE